MCGRYYFNDLEGIRKISEPLYDMIREEKKDTDFLEITPDMNAPVFSLSGEKLRLSRMRWGFQAVDGKLIINARSETIRERPMFSEIAKTQRCIIPGSGYFEWRRGDGQKFSFTLAEQQRLFYFAGLYRREDDGIRYIILTRMPTKEAAPIHNRMPVILPDKASVMNWLHDGDMHAHADEELRLNIKPVGSEQLSMQI